MADAKIIDIYDKLYDLTNENMHTAGKKLDMHKETFIFKQRSQKDIFDVSLSGDCENDIFLQIAYVGMLGRMPDAGAIKAWGNRISTPKDEFRRQIIERISMSEEFAKRDVKIINNIYNRALLNGSKKLWKHSRRIRKIKRKMYCVAKKGYARLPEKCKIIIKKAAKR